MNKLNNEDELDEWGIPISFDKIREIIACNLNKNHSFPYLTSSILMDMIINALEEKRPLSVVSIGQTESFVMAQSAIYSMEEVLRHPETITANQGIKKGLLHRGIHLPNLQARDALVEAAKHADIIGYNTLMPNGILAENVFEYYNINPSYVYEAYIRRVIMYSQEQKFEEMLRGRKILLISSIAEEVKNSLNKNLKQKLGFTIVGAISIYDYEEIPSVVEQISKHEFDLCLLAAGMNAVILAVYIAKNHGKVAFDLGGGLTTLVTNKIEEDLWLTELITKDTLMSL